MLTFLIARCDFAKMSWRVVITFPEKVGDEDNDLLHRVRNFGETLFHHFRDNGRGSVSIEEVDKATDFLVVERIRSRDLRRTVKMLAQMAQAEFPDRTPEITADKTTP